MNGNWVTAWSTAHTSLSIMAPKTAKKTVRATVTGNVSGSRIRIRLSNKMGPKLICIGSAFVRIGEKKPFEILYAGKQEINLEPGGYIISDPAGAEIKAGDEITVSLYYPNSNKPMSGIFSGSTVHSVKGNYAKDDNFEVEKYKTFMSKISPVKIPEPLSILAGVDIFTEDDVPVTAVLGDSLTQMGMWFNPLQSRLYKEYPEKVSFLNMAISGNRLLTDCNLFMIKQLYGLAGLKRMQWDLFELSGIKTVILELGVNDLILPGSGLSKNLPRLFDELINGYKNVIGECRKRGIKVIGCTPTPFGGIKAFNVKKEELRLKIRKWVMESGEYDHVIDFGAWVADPDNKSYMLKEFDSGDHLHPNDKGGECMAEHINSSWFI